MTSSIIADSSALFSLTIKKDRNNKLAKRVLESLFRRRDTVVIPAEVLTELLNILGRKVSHRVAIDVGRIILKEPAFAIVDTTKSLRDKTFDKFQNQPESVSFTDCLVMAMADEFETKKIFGFDETFRKNGYKRLGID